MKALALAGLLLLTGCGSDAGPHIVDPATLPGWKVRVYRGVELAREWTVKGNVRYAPKASRLTFQDAGTDQWIIVQGSCTITKD